MKQVGIGTTVIDATWRTVVRNAHVNWALIDQTMVSGVNFLTGILLARFLGLAEFGRFTLVYMAILFISGIQHATINSPMMSIGPKKSEAETDAYYGAVLFQQLAFSGSVFLLLFAGVEFGARAFPEWNVQDLALPIAVTAIVWQLQDFLRRYFFTRKRAATAFVIDTIRYVGQIAILAWLFFAHPDYLSTSTVLWVLSISSAVAIVYGTLSLGTVELSKATVRDVTLKHWSFSKWLIASAVTQWSTGNLFIVAAGAILGTSAVGAIRAAQNLMGITHILLLGLENVVPIRAAKHLKRDGRDAMFTYIRRVATVGGAAMSMIAMIAAVTPEFWLGLMFGPQYQGFGFVLQGWALIYVLIFLSTQLVSAHRALEVTQPVFWSTASTASFSLIAAYPLTLLFGLTGVMIGIATAQMILTVFLWKSLRRRVT